MMSSGKPIRNMPGSLRWRGARGARIPDPAPAAAHSRAVPARPESAFAGSDFGLRLEHLPATIHAGLEVDVVRTTQLARVLVLDIGRRLERVGGAPHAAARRRGLFPWHGHGIVLLELFRRRRAPPDVGEVRKPAYRGSGATRLGAGAFR